MRMLIPKHFAFAGMALSSDRLSVLRQRRRHLRVPGFATTASIGAEGLGTEHASNDRVVWVIGVPNFASIPQLKSAPHWVPHIVCGALQVTHN